MVIKFRKSKPPIKSLSVCLSVCLSLSLSLSLSHTHTYSLTHSENYCRSVYRKPGLKKKLLRTLKTILFAFTVAIVLGKYFENNTKKMANMKNLTMGEMRLLFIHTRVQYLCLNYLDEENMDEFKYKPLCDYCEMKLLSNRLLIVNYVLHAMAKLPNVVLSGNHTIQPVNPSHVTLNELVH